jgi:hypothetical protein
MNDGASALRFHSADDTTALDDVTASTAGQIPRPKKRRISSTPIGTARFRTLFLENPDDRDITLFTTLMMAKPFARAKARAFWKLGRRLLMALTARSTRPPVGGS